MIGAFFDVDGTLYTAHMWRGLMQYASEHGRKNRVRLYYAALMPLYLFRKLRLISEESFRRPWVSRMGWIFRGWNAAEGDAAFRWIAEDFTRPTARDDILAHLHEHVAKGHAVILVSAQLAPSLAKLGASLGATGTVRTEIEVKDARVLARARPGGGPERELRVRGFDQRLAAVRDGRASGRGVPRPAARRARARKELGDSTEGEVAS